MELERNNDYSISNRLLGLYLISGVSIHSSTNQITPRNYLDPQVIYWDKSKDGRISFYHCLDRSMIASCKMMGTRSYSESELKEAAASLHRSYLASEKSYQKRKLAVKTLLIISVATIGVVAVATGGLAAGGIVAANLKGVALSTFFATGLVGGTILLKQGDALEHSRIFQFELSKQIADQKSGAAGIDNFTLYARTINEFLLNVEAQYPNGNGPQRMN
jgi:hypothetical protein